MIKPKFQGKYRVESTRLPNRNYAANGWYFITICTKDCLHHFGKVMSIYLKSLATINLKTDGRFWEKVGNLKTSDRFATHPQYGISEPAVNAVVRSIAKPAIR